MEEVQEISNESDKFVQEVDNLNDQLSNDRNCDGGIKSLLKEILNQIGIVIDEIRNLNLHLKNLLIQMKIRLAQAVCVKIFVSRMGRMMICG